MVKEILVTGQNYLTKRIWINVQGNLIFRTDRTEKEIGVSFLNSGYKIGGHLPKLPNYKHSTNTP